MEITKEFLASEIMLLGQQEQQARIQAENLSGARRALESMMNRLGMPEPEPKAEVVAGPDLSVVPKPKRKRKKAKK